MTSLKSQDDNEYSMARDFRSMLAYGALVRQSFESLNSQPVADNKQIEVIADKGSEGEEEIMKDRESTATAGKSTEEMHFPYKVVVEFDVYKKTISGNSLLKEFIDTLNAMNIRSCIVWSKVLLAVCNA